MTIVNKDLFPDASLRDLVSASKKLNAVIIQRFSSAKGSPDGAVIVVHGRDTKAYLKAIERIDELLEEDCDDMPY